MSIQVEIAVQDLAGLEVAAEAGAHRVELSADLARGGVTPPTELVRSAVERARQLASAGDARAAFDVHVLIRPRASTGDFLDRPEEFVHTSEEVELMARQAAEAVEAGAAGIVVGALRGPDALDREALETIRDAALQAASRALRGVTLTHHRALDAMEGRAARVAAVEQLIGLGFHRVLSSGGAASALEGAEDLAAMVDAGEELIEVCAGAGVRPGTIADLVRATGVTDVHLSARRRADAPREAGAPDTETDPAIVAAAVDAAGAL